MRAGWWALVALLVVALAAGCDSESGNGGDDGNGDEPAAAESSDTGRMSETEYDTASMAVSQLDGEITDYRTKIGDRCSVLIGGFETAAALECIDEAYDGVETQASLTFSDLDGMREDVLKRCSKALNRAVQIVNEPLFQALSASKAAFDTLEPAAVRPAIRELNQQDRRWSQASQNMLTLCSPE
jgi:hypothetical protein